MGTVVKFKSNHAYGEMKSRVVGKAVASRKDAQNTFLTLNEFLESKFAGTKRKTNSVDAVAIGLRHGIDPDLLSSVKKSADQSIIAMTGEVIYGESAGDLFGWSIDMSEDGLHLAVGSILNDGGGTNAGSVRVYSRANEEGAWVQRGVDIDGEVAQDYSAWSISLSSDGNRLVIGAVFNDDGSTLNSGHVRIYDWNSETTQWEQMGSDINGGSAADLFGYSVSLSKNKNYIAVGAPYGLNTRGYVRVYYYDGSSWGQVGDDLEGAQPSPNGEYFGKKVVISEDGSRLVVSAPQYYYSTGKVNLYSVNQGSNSITLLDSKIGSLFFTRTGHSLDLKSNILAVSETGFTSPKIIIYDISSDSFLEQANNTIPLLYAFDIQIKLSYDGNNLIYGMSGFNSDSGIINSRRMLGTRGHVEIFKRENNRWTRQGWKIKSIGGGATDEFGKSVSISGDGGIIALSAPRKDVPSEDTGCVTAYTVKPISHYVTPTITLNSLNPFPLQANTTYVEPGAVTDTGATVTIEGDIEDSSIEGEQYEIVYTAQNGFGNVVTKTRQVIIIKDPAIPTMVLNGDPVILVKVNGVFNDPGVTSSILSTITTDRSKLNMSKLGSYEVSYSAISTYGIPSTQLISRTVIVVNDIDYVGSELVGDKMCMSRDGYVVANSIIADDTVVLSEWDPVPSNYDWKSMGQKIQGPTNSSFGVALALSNDGLTAVIGAPAFNTTGLVRVYAYDFVINKWVQKGGDIFDGVDGDGFGQFVAISGNGSVVSSGSSQPTGTKNPYIFTYRYTESSDTWVKIHEYMEPLTLPSSVEKKPFSCALNNDGSLILIGSPLNNYTTGAVFVYNTSDDSIKFSVLGTVVGEYFGEYVDFSSDARRIAIGDIGNACVKIFNQDEVSSVWSQLGDKIYYAGSSVKLSRNGDIVTFSIPSTTGYGKVYQYKWDGSFWSPITGEFSDNGVGTSFGRQVFVSEDASSIFVGSSITNQLFRWNVARPSFILNGTRITRLQVDQDYNYDYVTTGSNLDISGVVNTSVTSEYRVKYTMTENDISDVIYQIVSVSGELLQLGLTLQSFVASSTPIKLGWSISMSGDGNYIVVGMPGFDENRGMVKIYKFNPVEVIWDEMVSLSGPNPGGSYGWDVSISKDGSRVAIGAPDFEEGLVEVYEYTASWNMIGPRIFGSDTGDKFGWSVSLSGSGEFLTIGEPRKSFQGGIVTGVGGVKTYRYISSTWSPETSLSFENTQIEHQIGYDVAISSTNQVVLFGAPTAGPGYVKISSYVNGLVPIFAQPITFGERFGWCVSISDDGLLFAVGAPFFNAKRGRVLIYDANTTPPSLKGSPIIGANENDELGSSIQLSGNGAKLLVYSKAGRVSAYQYVGSEWVIISGEIITSTDTDGNFGYSLSSSTSGNRLVISSPLSDNSLGKVQVYSTETSQITAADFIDPVISLNGSPSIIHRKDTNFIESGVTRDDGEAGFDVTGAVNSSVVGSYTLVYSATDTGGNVSGSLNRTVNVEEVNIVNRSGEFQAPSSTFSRNSNTSLSGNRVAFCNPSAQVYEVSEDVYPPTFNQFGQTLPDGNQVGLSQDGTKLYTTTIVDNDTSVVSVYSLSDTTNVVAQAPFTNTVTNADVFEFDNKSNYETTRTNGSWSAYNNNPPDTTPGLFGTGVIPYGDRYRQSFKFKSLAMTSDGRYIAIGKPHQTSPKVSIYEYDPTVINFETYNQVGYTTSAIPGIIANPGISRIGNKSLAVSEACDRLITQNESNVYIYNRDDSSISGWNEEFVVSTNSFEGKVALSRDGNVAAFVQEGGSSVTPIILNGESTIIHTKSVAFTDPGFSYSGAESVSVTGTVDVDTEGEYIIKYETSDKIQVRIVRVTQAVNTTMNGSYSTTNIPYGPSFAGWTGTWRNQDFPLFTVPTDFVYFPQTDFELSITLNGVIPVAGNWQYMSIQIYTDDGFSTSISFTSNGSGQGENYYGGRSIYTNKVRTKTSIDSGVLRAGDLVRGRLHLYNTFFSTFSVDVTVNFTTDSNTTTSIGIPTVSLVGLSQNEIQTGDNFVDPGVTSTNSTGVITKVVDPSFPQTTPCIKAIIYRAVNTSGIYGYAVRYINVLNPERVLLYGRSGVTWSLIADPIPTDPSLSDNSLSHYGGNLALSNDGSRVVILKYNKILIYDLNKIVFPSVWVETAVFLIPNTTPPLPYHNSQLGGGPCIAMSGNGDTIAVGLKGTTNTLAVHIFQLTSTSWALQQSILYESTLPGNILDVTFQSLDMTKDGQHIAFGLYNSKLRYGFVSVYNISGTKKGQTIYSTTTPKLTGDRVSISSDGNRLVTIREISGGQKVHAYYEFVGGSNSWVEFAPNFVNTEVSDLLEVFLRGNGYEILSLYATLNSNNGFWKVRSRIITPGPTGWTKKGNDITMASLSGPPATTSAYSPLGCRSSPGEIIGPGVTTGFDTYDGAQMGHVVEISEDGTFVALGLPYLQMGYINGTTGYTATRGAAVVFEFNGSDWSQLGGLIVPKYVQVGIDTNNAIQTQKNVEAETITHNGASISLSSDGQYLCVGTPGHFPREMDVDTSGDQLYVINGGSAVNRRYNSSLPSMATSEGFLPSWSLYRRNASWTDQFSVGWEPIHRKYAGLSQSFATEGINTSTRFTSELIGHSVKVSNDGSFVVYDTRTDGIKIEAYNSGTNSWSTLQHIPHDVTNYLNTIDYTYNGTSYTIPLSELGVNNSSGTADRYTISGVGIGPGGSDSHHYAARFWPHSYISLSQNEQFLTVSEPEVQLPAYIRSSTNYVQTPAYTKSNRQPRVNVYKKTSSGTFVPHGNTILGDPTEGSALHMNPFASSSSSISNDGTRLIVPSKQVSGSAGNDYVYVYDYNKINNTWIPNTANPIVIGLTGDNGSMNDREKQMFIAAAQSTTLMTSDGTSMMSLYYGDESATSTPIFTNYLITQELPSPSWRQLGFDITVDSVNQNTTSVSLSNDATKLAIGIGTANEVRVMNYSSNLWGQVTTLTGTGNFGDQISMSRDGDSLAVSAPGVNNGEVLLYDTSTSSVVQKANPLQNSSNRSNNKFGYSLFLNDDCTRLFVGDPDYETDIANPNYDTGRVVIKEYDATIDSVTGLPLGFSSGTEVVITRGGNLQVAAGDYTRFGESLDVSGDGTRMIVGRFGYGSDYTDLEIAELWDRDSQTGNWSKNNSIPDLVPNMTGSISPPDTSFQSPIVKLSDSGNFFLHGVSERSGYGSNVAVTTKNQYFSPILTLNGDSSIDLIVGETYTELGCTSDDSSDTIVITNDIVNSIIGIYTVRYTVTRFGIMNFIERKVNVTTSSVPPTITLIGDSVINIIQGNVYTEPDPPVSLLGGILETYGVPPDGFTSGTFTMRYVVRNAFGVASVERTITVIPDTTPPVITILGGDITHKVSTTYNDPSYIGSDGNENVITRAPRSYARISEIQNIRGTHSVTYTASDQYGNSGTSVRSVHVKDDKEATTIQQQLDDSYYSSISNDGSRQAIIRKTTNDVVVYDIPKSFVQSFGGFGSMNGQMVKLSADGQIVAFTASDGVRVFAYELGMWGERTAVPSRFAQNGSYLYHIELSNDGNTIAVSYPGGNEQYLEEVVVFKWDSSSSQYEEDHSIANGTAVATGLGDAVSLSSNGNRIALGSRKTSTGVSGTGISSSIYSFTNPSPIRHGVLMWYYYSQRWYKLTSYGRHGQNNTMYWSVTMGSSWSVSWEWYIYGPRWGGADDMRMIYYATNPITAYQASVHNGYNNFYEFWQGDTHQIRDNNDIYKNYRNVYYPLYRWLKIEVSYDNGIMTSTVKNTNGSVISSVSHNFGNEHQSLYNTQTYFGFSGRTGGVTSSQYIRNINLKNSGQQLNTGKIEVYERNPVTTVWNPVGGDITGGFENQGLGKNVKLSGDGSTILNRNNGQDANGQNVSIFTLNSGTWTQNSTLIDNLNTRTLLSGEADISDDGSFLIYAKGTGNEKYATHPSGLSTKYIDGYKLENGVYKHALTIPESSSSSTTKHVEVTGDKSKILIHNDDQVVLYSVTDTVFNPVITLNHRDDLDTLTTTSYTEQGATSNVTDGSSVVVGGETVTNTPGTYRVTYSVTDTNTGKSGHRTRTVIIT